MSNSLETILLRFGPPTRRVILLAVVVGVPLFFLEGITHDPYNVPKLALLMAATATAGAVRIAELLVGGPPLQWRLLAVPAAAILVPLTLSWAFSPYRGWAVFGEYGRFQGLLPYAVVVLFGILLAEAFRGRAVQVAWALVAAGAGVGGYSLVQMLGLDPVPHLVDGIEIATNISTIGHTNFTGGFMAIALPLSIYLWGRAPRFGLVAAGATILIAAGVVLSSSQAGWAAALAGLAVVTGSLLGEDRPRLRVLGLFTAATVAVIVGGSVLLSLIMPQSSVLGGTVRTRGYLWTSAIGMAAESPIVGRGPNSYAIEGVRHRPLPSALSEQYAAADDPHSVPLAFLANAGILGLLGWLIAIGWMIRRGMLAPAGTLQAAFFAALVAYVVQSLVSIDVVSLRVALWSVIGGMVAATTVNPIEDGNTAEPGRSRRSVPAMVVLVALVVGIGTTWAWAARYLLADARVEHAIELFEEDNVGESLSEFEDALALRDEPEYRRLYASHLGVAGLNQARAGAPLIQKMLRVDSYLDTFPKTSNILSSATLLHYWGTFDAEGDKQALQLFRRALRYDPYNPLIRAQIAEVLIDLDREDEAVDFLEATTEWYLGAAPEFWGALATARLVAGDETGAQEALDHGQAISPRDCRVAIAAELLEVGDRDPKAPPAPGAALTLGFKCPKGLYDFFLERLPPRARDMYD